MPVARVNAACADSSLPRSQVMVLRNCWGRVVIEAVRAVFIASARPVLKWSRFSSVRVDGKIWGMSKKFDQDAKDRVVRLVEDRILAEGISIQEACQVVAPKLGVSWHTARRWLQQARKPGRLVRAEEDVIAENARPRRENQELRDTNELLKAASAFFAKELDPKRRK